MDNWQRIDSVIRWANMTINCFALYIGLPRGENLYQIKKGNNGISRNLAYKIVTKFPEVSLAWLLTGEGQMFVDEKLCGVRFIRWMSNPISPVLTSWPPIGRW